MTDPAPRLGLVQGEAVATNRPMVEEVAVPVSVEEFCESLSVTLVKMLTVRVGDRFVAEEIAQEALARAVADWDKIRSMENPAGFVYRTALNLSTSLFRRKQSERRAMKRFRARPTTAPHIESAGLSEFRKITKTLTSRQRDVIALRYGADLSVDATAELLSISPGTVKTLTHRALAKLREDVDRSGDDG